jgi:predicted PolB exonuclease-like 3'-5' exonuclease
MSALEDVALHLGIPTPKDIMHGSEVQKFYDDGKLDLIKEYCRHDVKATALIYQKFKSLNFL